MAQILVLQHHPAEDLGRIARSLERAALAQQYVRIHEGRPVPATIEGADGLIVLGGPMAVYQQDKYAFLRDEMRLVEAAAKKELPVLGVCFGAQVVAAALGARVIRNPAGKEIGWHRVMLTDAAGTDRLFAGIAKAITPFHWHGDIFELPSGATSLALSEKTPCQALRFENNVYALQFHLEVTTESIAAMAAAWPRELEREKIAADKMIAASAHYQADLERIAAVVFDRWAESVRETVE